MRKEFGILTLFIALCAIVAVLNPQFLSAANIQNTSRLIGTYGIFSIGVGIVIVTGGIDLSVGSVVAIASVILGLTMVRAGMPIWISILITVVAVRLALLKPGIRREMTKYV